MVVLVAIILPILLIAVYFAVDTAYMQLARTQLRTAADAAARAGTETLLRTRDERLSVQAAMQFAESNSVAGQPLELATEDVTLGHASSRPNRPWKFVAGEYPLNAVRVVARRTDDSPSGAIRLLFWSLSGVEFFQPTQIATAAQVDQDFAIVLEAGGSMHAPERWTGVRKALQAFGEVLLESGNQHSICLIECHNEPSVRMPLTHKTEPLGDVLDQMHQEVSEIKLRQGRGLGPGLKLASDILAGDPHASPLAAKRILFLGNGNHNQGIEPPQAARIAATRGQEIHVLTFGHNPDRDGQMQQSAQITGGSYHHVANTATLPEIFDEIANTLSIVMIE
ncbi:MAG: pilus assembly protein TadG-related protein [Planctomycetota bacterium]|nr:pilus assembly protein TadG-related protein [Planctomycetota bacterium]